jgi:aspartate racemase
MIGVIGGMGPLATVDFMHKVILATPAEDDAQHVPLLVSNDPRIPRRPAAILGAGESPLPRLLEIRDRLLHAGATALVMPCNTAHHWHAALRAGCAVPFPSIVDAACDEAAGRAAGAQGTGRIGRIGLIATQATLQAGLFDAALAQRGLAPVLPTGPVTEAGMLPAIAHVKAGRLAEAGPPMVQAVQSLLDAGADAVILACTEAPIALQDAPGTLLARCIDSTLSLARVTVALWQRQQGSAAVA